MYLSLLRQSRNIPWKTPSALARRRFICVSAIRYNAKVSQDPMTGELTSLPDIEVCLSNAVSYPLVTKHVTSLQD